MIEAMIENFKPRFGNTEVDIKTCVGSVERSEGFILKAERTGDKIRAEICYVHPRAVRYALNALLKFVKSRDAKVELSDAPDFPVRGVVEGFYGRPWTHDQRLRAIEKFGDFNFNTYFVAPKDVPWQRFNWRSPFNEEFIAKTSELIDHGRLHGVDVTACVSPGLSVKYSDLNDVTAVVNRFKQLYAIGARHFSLLWDDIAWELSHSEDIERFPTTAHAQAWFTNQVFEQLIAIDFTISMTVCPMHYCGRGTEPYLVEIGPLLSPRINLMWTGRDICSAYLDISDAVIFTRSTLRPPLYWDNFPVNDGGMQRSLYIGPVRGREVGLQKFSAGLLSNPMLQAEMSLIPLKTIGDYLWNTAAYNPESSWEEALTGLVDQPEALAALRRFLRVSMWTTVGGDPAPDLRQVFRKGVTHWRAGELTEAGDVFITEGKAIIKNAEYLLSESFSYPRIKSEIGPWMEKYVLGGEVLIGLGEALKLCTFDSELRMIQGSKEVISTLEALVEKYQSPKKSLFGDQIDGPINELIGELGARND